jgi:hypothetical protein
MARLQQVYNPVPGGQSELIPWFNTPDSLSLIDKQHAPRVPPVGPWRCLNGSTSLTLTLSSPSSSTAAIAPPATMSDDEDFMQESDEEQ